MRTKKVLFVATVKTHIESFHVPYLQWFKEEGWETAVCANSTLQKTQLAIPYCDHYYDIPFSRSPLGTDNVKAYKALKKIIEENDYDIVHCHTPMGGVMARLACRKERKKGAKVIYTAHGFHFYKGAPLLNWFVYYPVERWLARYTDVLITINKEDYVRAQKFKAGKVEYVPGVGVDTEKFSTHRGDRTEKRKELGLREEDFILLSVGELIPRKNHMVALKGLALLKDKQEYQNIHYLVCGQGCLNEELKQKTEAYGIEDHVHFLGFRRDISQICNSSDLFVFMSLQEGLPVALMEAMGCGMPSICSRIRGITDLIDDGIEGVLVDNDEYDVAQAILEMYNNVSRCRIIGAAAKEKIRHFDLDEVKKELVRIYRNEYINEAN